MVFSDTTGKAGLIQACEFWCRFPDTGISGNSVLLAQFTRRINAAFEKIMPLLLSYSDYIRWDDVNNTNRPIGTFNLVSGQSDYTIKKDDQNLDILNVIAVRILSSTTATEYDDLELIPLNDERVLDAMSPNSSVTGVPYAYVENGNHLFLYPKPDYSKASGVKVFYSRKHDYFAATGDETQEPGIPSPFHELLALHASLDWNMVNRTDDGNLITMLRQKIKEIETELRNFMDLRNPTKVVMTHKKIQYI